MKIVVWRGVIVDYLFIAPFLGSGDIVIAADARELKRYWDRP